MSRIINLIVTCFFACSVAAFDHDPFEALSLDFRNQTKLIQDELNRIFDERARLEWQLAKLEEKLTDAMINAEEINDSFHNGSQKPYLVAAKDILVSNWFSSTFFNGLGHSVFLAAGNQFSNYNDPKNAKHKNRLIELLKKLRAKKIFIVYDADSLASSIIENIIPENSRMGLSGRARPIKSKRGTIYSIENPYLRMNAIFEFENIILTPDSILAAGLLVEQYSRSGDKEYFILGSTALASGLSEWSKRLNKSKDSENLGISYHKVSPPDSFKSPIELANALVEKFGSTGTRTKEYPHINEVLSGLDADAIDECVDWAKDYAKSLKDFDQNSEFKTEYLGGAVLFGSGRGSHYYEKQVKNVAKKIAQQMPLVTGGEGGFMATANRAAKDVGGYSVGITIGHKNKNRETGLHSLLVSVNGYEQRIPYLLHNRKAIVFAPGGMGTMKELATALVKFAAAKKITVPLIFINDTYYKGLTQWLSSIMPEELSRKIVLFDSDENFINTYLRFLTLWP